MVAVVRGIGTAKRTFSALLTVHITARLASTHTALVSQSLVGHCVSPSHQALSTLYPPSGGGEVTQTRINK